MKKQTLAVLIFLFSSVLVHSQEISLSFEAKNIHNQQPLPLDSVFVENMTVGGDTMLYGPSPTLVLPLIVGLNIANGDQTAFIDLAPVAPNPFNGRTTATVNLPEASPLILSVSNAKGTIVYSHEGYYEAGAHKFEIETEVSGLLLLSAMNRNSSSHVKLINDPSFHNNNRINYLGFCKNMTQFKSEAQVNEFSFFIGNQLAYSPFLTNYEGESIVDSPASDTLYTFLLTALPTLPLVETYPATEITDNSAVVGGEVLDEGNLDVTERGICWGTEPLPDLTSNVVYIGSGLGDFHTTIENLDPTTTYFVRAFATNALGTSFGEQQDFETLVEPSIPHVITSMVNEIGYATAVSGGEVVSDGGYPVTSRGICWGTMPNPDLQGNHTLDGTGIGSFVSYLNGLMPNTNYYVRAYATNQLGTDYGETLSFTTEVLNGFMIWFAGVGASYNVDSVRVDNLISSQSIHLNGSDTLVLILATSKDKTEKVNVQLNKSKKIKNNSSQRTPAIVEMPYNLHEQLYLKFYSGSHMTVMPFIPNQNTRLTANFAACEDISGSNYSTVTVNGGQTSRKSREQGHTQVWMVQNLDLGEQIDGSVEQSDNGIIEKYCFDNDPENCETYGGLYLWNEAMQYDTLSSSQGICPSGWRIATDEEWCAYTSYLDPTSDCGSDWPGYDVGRKLKAHFGWNVANGTNSSGFTALPGALRDQNGDFLGYLGCASFWWTSTHTSDSMAMARHLYCTRDEIAREVLHINNAFSVRCIYDYSLPTVLTEPIINITPTGATGGGEIVSDGGTSIDDRGLVWSTEPNPSLNDSVVSVGIGFVGSYAAVINTLEPYTFYYVRAYAVNSAGVAYGNEVSFVTNTTSPAVPTIVTSEITEITQISAISGGEILSDGGDAVIAKGVCWGINQNPTINDSCTNEGMGDDLFESILSGLDTLQTYFVRSYASNSIGTSYGNQLVFTTLPNPNPCNGIDSIYFENQFYQTVEIGFQCWLKQNLNAGQMIEGDQESTDNGIFEKYCLDNDSANCEQYGGLYQWGEAMQYEITEGARGICPEGWHVATEDDWVELTSNYGGFQFAGHELKLDTNPWTEDCQGSNSSGFSALMTGLRFGDGTFCGLCIDAGYYWTARQFAEGLSKTHLIGCGDSVWPDTNYQSWGYAVRCVKD